MFYVSYYNKRIKVNTYTLKSAKDQGMRSGVVTRSQEQRDTAATCQPGQGRAGAPAGRGWPAASTLQG